MMKTVHLLLLSLLLVCLTACDDSNEMPYTGAEYLWTPSLQESLVADASVTLQWAEETSLYTGYELNTKCFIANYVSPEKFEIYQSDQPYDGFTKIAELKNNDKAVSYKVSNLPNGKTVYFLVKSLRKGYDTMESGSYAFIPNPRPGSEVVLTTAQLSDYAIALSVSPTAEKIAYINVESGRALYVCDMNGTGKLRVADDAYSSLWSHDGSLLYFVTGFNSTASQLKSYNLTTRETALVMDNTGYLQDWTVSPDGSKVLYNRNQNGDLNLYVYQVESAKDSLIMNRNMGGNWLEYTEPVWIDNENYMVKKAKVNTPYTVSLSLVSYPDNQAEELLADYSHAYSYAVLSPDKKQIVYMDIHNYSPNLILYDRETRSLRQLSGYEPGTSIDYTHRHLVWKDTRTLYHVEYSHADGARRIRAVSIP